MFKPKSKKAVGLRNMLPLRWRLYTPLKCTRNRPKTALGHLKIGHGREKGREGRAGERRKKEKPHTTTTTYILAGGCATA